MANGEFLRQHADDPELASHVMHDYTQADLDPQTRGMVDFAIKLTREPASMEETDVHTLRRLGLTDEQILSVVLATYMKNFLNRLANGLGVALAPERQKDVAGWLQGRATQQEWLMRPTSQS